MKKRIAIVLVAILLGVIVFGLCSCSMTELRTNDKEINEEYAFVSGLQDIDFVYNKETKICYLMICKQIGADDWEYAFIMLYDKNGEPLLYEGKI